MGEWMITYGSWGLALVGLTGLWITGLKKTYGWLFNLAAQILWTVYLTTTEQYGLLLGTAGYTFVYLRNWLRWRADDRKIKEDVHERDPHVHPAV